MTHVVDTYLGKPIASLQRLASSLASDLWISSAGAGLDECRRLLACQENRRVSSMYDRFDARAESQPGPGKYLVPHITADHDCNGHLDSATCHWPE